MKKIMIMVSAIMMAATIYAEPESIKPFEEISVEVPARVRIIQGNEYGIQVVSADSTRNEDVIYTVENGVLKIKTENSSILGSSPRNTVITIITPADDAKVTTGNDMDKRTVRKHNR